MTFAFHVINTQTESRAAFPRAAVTKATTYKSKTRARDAHRGLLHLFPLVLRAVRAMRSHGRDFGIRGTRVVS